MALEHRFLQLLELPTSAAASSVFLSSKMRDSIFNEGKIHGVVQADLPRRSFLSTLLSTSLETRRTPSKTKKRILPRPESSVLREVLAREVESVVQQAGCWQVRTVAAQLRNMREIRRRLVATAQALDATRCGGSLLLVSGGHPLRRFPFAERLLPGSSFDMLQMASKLRQTGELPAGVQLWAVENPLENTIDRLEQKILSGAETVILQPPLLQGRFEDWWDLAHNRGIMEKVRIVVGLPLITSADNLEFWFGLTQTTGEQVDLRLAKLRNSEAAQSLDKQALSNVYKEETRRLIKFIKNLPGVAGMHIMPATPSGWRQFAALQMEQTF